MYVEDDLVGEICARDWGLPSACRLEVRGQIRTVFYVSRTSYDGKSDWSAELFTLWYAGGLGFSAQLNGVGYTRKADLLRAVWATLRSEFARKQIAGLEELYQREAVRQTGGEEVHALRARVRELEARVRELESALSGVRSSTYTDAP